MKTPVPVNDAPVAGVSEGRIPVTPNVVELPVEAAVLLAFESVMVVESTVSPRRKQVTFSEVSDRIRELSRRTY